MAGNPAQPIPIPAPDVAARVDAFATERLPTTTPIAASGDAVWQGLRDVGTELWLDTGDIEGAASLWSAEFSALTTNNTLLNAEVQKGIYDDIVASAGEVLSGIDPRVLVVEIAFALNVRHGLRLRETFGARISVELHTLLAHDVEATLVYARRLYRICPDGFIVKIPLTPAGLIATRRLAEEGVPINFTLGFSARHNYLATAFAKPAYVNVFLGRLNAYVLDNELGDGQYVGEKATLASQSAVREMSTAGTTRQIAASLRSASQVADLAGVDVMTMPLNVAAAAGQNEDGWSNRREARYDVTVEASARPETLWEVNDAERRLGESLDANPPRTAEELVARSEELGARDLFPRLTEADRSQIAADGKIPVHSRWAERIQRGELAIDTLLNLAGLTSFSADQQALDDRIRGLVL